MTAAMHFSSVILKLKRTPGIYLVGFMGCGKSTVGHALSEHLGWPFVDLDQEIENSAKAPPFPKFSNREARRNSGASSPKF